MNPSTQEAAGSPTKQSVYERITARILHSLEQGVRPWVQPWSTAHPAGPLTRPLRHNAAPYTGINVLALWCTAMERGYTAPIWMTFRQALELGAHVRKGEAGTLVVYANSITVEDSDSEESDRTERRVRFLKGYTVFNVEQIEGLPSAYTTERPRIANRDDRIVHAERFVTAAGVPVRHGGNRACYSPTGDFIQLPPFEAFRDVESFYSTCCHELVHSTAHPSRLGRELGKRFGDTAYAAEELIAEIGSAFLSADLGIAAEPREDHASYIRVWLEVLRGDSHAIFTAASQAQRAVEFLHARVGAAG